MKWTTEKPKAEGWYWWREFRGQVVVTSETVVLIKTGKVWFANGRRENIKNLHGEWSSEPIPMPEEIKC